MICLIRIYIHRMGRIDQSADTVLMTRNQLHCVHVLYCKIRYFNVFLLAFFQKTLSKITNYLHRTKRLPKIHLRILRYKKLQESLHHSRDPAPVGLLKWVKGQTKQPMWFWVVRVHFGLVDFLVYQNL